MLLRNMTKWGQQQLWTTVMLLCGHSKPLATSAMQNKIVEPTHLGSSFVKWGVPTKEAFEFLNCSGKRWEAKQTFEQKLLFLRQGGLMAVRPFLSKTQTLPRHSTAHRLCPMTFRTIALSSRKRDVETLQNWFSSTEMYSAAVVNESWEELPHSVPGTNKRVGLVLGRSHPKQQFSSQWASRPVNRCLKLQDG